jgi:hypothetical protein
MLEFRGLEKKQVINQMKELTVEFLVRTLNHEPMTCITFHEPMAIIFAQHNSSVSAFSWREVGRLVGILFACLFGGFRLLLMLTAGALL